MVLGAAVAPWLALTSVPIVPIRGRGKSKSTARGVREFAPVPHPPLLVLDLQLTSSWLLVRLWLTWARTCRTTLVLALLAALLTTVAFLFDVISIAVAKHCISDDSNGIMSRVWGNMSCPCLVCICILS